MRNIWFGLLSVTTSAGAFAIGCGSQPEPSTGASSSSSAAASGSSVSAGSGGGSGGASSASSASGMGGESSAHGSSHSAAGSGGAGGGGGSGGGCALPADCPGTDSECQQRTCTQGVCGIFNVANDTATATQAAGDCKKTVCDGLGAIKVVNDDTDKPIDTKQCTADICSNGKPSNPNLALGLPCAEDSGHYCDGAGTCVECVKNADCTSNFCQANVCVVASCTDNIKNGEETDIDCGGPLCNDCVDGQVCAANNDCVNQVCTNSVCQAPSCTDAAKNGAETDVDCGGPICGGTCTDGKVCAAGSDCVNKVCTGAVCQGASCSDAQKNGAETDVDCGGICAQKCGLGKGCGLNTDCIGGNCNPATQVCDPSCTDGVKNGAETDVDCGGVCATKCGLGKACGSAGDCAGGICDGGTCVQINGCDLSNAEDFTGTSSVAIAFGGAVGLTYKPKCIKVSAGAQVTFNGAFGSHPLVAGEVKGGVRVPAAAGTTPLPINPGKNTGTSASFTMAPAGAYPYYCFPHATIGMNGAIFVVP